MKIINLASGFVVLAAGIACAPVAQADGNAANLDQLVARVYNQVQSRCASSMHVRHSATLGMSREEHCLSKEAGTPS